MADVDDYAKRTARIKNLLSSYYGGSEPPGGGGGAASSQPSTPTGGSPHSGGGASAGGAPQSQPTQPRPRAAPQPPGLDAPGFDAARHAAALLRQLPLDRLMAEHKSLAREIRNLDGDMQQLVYENYAKFIDATDTIRDMHASVDAMDGDMASLRRVMDGVVEASGAVDGKLSARRRECEELRRVEAALTRLQSAYELPARMRAALEEGALEAAVELYADAAPLLARYGNSGALAGVKAGADAAARDAAAALKRAMSERCGGGAERAVLLLRRLGEGGGALRDKYLEGRVARMREALEEASAAADLIAAAADAIAASGSGSDGTNSSSSGGSINLPQSGPLASAAARAAWGVPSAPGGLPSLEAYAAMLGTRVIGALQETAVNMATIFAAKGGDNGSGDGGDDGSSDEGARKALVKAGKGVVSEYFRLLRRAAEATSRAAAAAAARLPEATAAVECPGGAGSGGSGGGDALAFASDWGADALARAMAAVAADARALHPHLPELSLPDYAAAAAEQAARAHAAAAAWALRARVALALRALGTRQGGDGDSATSAPTPEALSAAAAAACDVTQRCALAMIQGLGAYSARHAALFGAQVLSAVGDAAAANLHALLAGLAGHLLAAARVRDDSQPPAGRGGGGGGGGDRARAPSAGLPPLELGASAKVPPSPPQLLALARVCFYLETTTVPAVMEALLSALPGAAGTGGDGPPPFVAGDAARRLGGAGAALLAAYVDSHGRELTAVVEAAAARPDWQAAEGEPDGPRALCGELCSKLAAAEDEVVALIPDAAAAAAAGGAQRGGGYHHGRTGSGVSNRDSAPAPFMLGAAGAAGAGAGAAVARLFRARTKLGGAVPLARAPVLAAIAAHGLRSLVETVRLAPALPAAALRRLQVDVAALRAPLLRAAGGAEAVAQLLDEALAAGLERAAAPGAALLEPAALERLLARRQGA